MSQLKKENESLNPTVDNILRDIIKPGQIRAVRHFNNFSTRKPIVIYDIVGNRFCRNINRQHLSNNVYYVFDIYNKSFIQRCYDPDCSDYKSCEIKIDHLL